MAQLTRAIALDCEMVGVAHNQDMVARVTLVNEHLECIMDTFVKPTQRVMDYRTPVSGVRKADLENGEDFNEVQQKVKTIITGRILVGHGLMEHDLRVLKITHPLRLIRDTGEYGPFKKLYRNRTPPLRWLAELYLGVRIQKGEHSSLEDARTAMQLYRKFATDWEKSLGN